MKLSFVLLPNRKPPIDIPHEQQRFWDAQWLGRFKCTKKAAQINEIGSVFDQPEIPYTALYLIGLLKHNMNVDVNIIDLWDKGTSCLDTSKLESSTNYSDVYLFSPFTNNYSFAKKCINIIKNINRKAICVTGGHHASYCAEECLEDGFDYVVIGRGEKALLQLASSSWQYSNKIIYGTEGSRKEEEIWQDSLPDYRLLPDRYKRTYYARLFTSHGCPFRCIFCSNTVWHKKKPIFMPIRRVIKELSLIRSNISFEEIYVNDENFTLNKNHFTQISEFLKEQDIKWGCETRIDTVDEQKLRFLSKMGCKEIDYGLESLDNNILNIVKKGINSNDAYRIFSATTANGIRCHINLMVGLPGETTSTAQKTVDIICDWLQKGVISTVDYFITVPYPGTELFEHQSKFGLKLKTMDWDQYREDSMPVFDHSIMTSKDIYTCWLRGLAKISETLEYLWR